jgi:hypothetical protein
MSVQNDILLTRDAFRNAVFERDEHKCVICGAPAVDAHHIMERRLFSDGGYYLDNGASLCQVHHLEAESTKLSTQTIRDACKIGRVILPEHLYSEAEYDKWGNEILKNGERLMGELFHDESVQKIMDKTVIFTDFVKYPRTFHLPWSPGMSRDDRQMGDVTVFEGQEVMICEKLDGENCLDENTLIETEDGEKTIKEICETKYFGKVLSYNIETGKKEFKKITNYQILENNDDWYLIEIDSGENIILTGNHYVYLPKEKVYKEVKYLKENDEVLLKSG